MADRDTGKSEDYREATEEEITTDNNKKSQEIINNEALQFLADTDWKIIRQTEQNTMSDADYAELLQQRQEARSRVVK